MNQEKKNAVKYLKTVKGQIEGIISMIEDDRYCIDISNQISASSALLKKVNAEILKGHINGCLVSAIENNENIDDKMAEIYDTLLKFGK